MKSKLKTTKYKSSLLIPTLIGAALVASLVFGVLFYGKKTTDNYAKDVAQPLEEALVKIGAVHKCSTGDAGRGPDNIEPWYDSYYELAADRQQAAAIINNVATDNGYKLIHANPNNRGPLDVDDKYINNWYFDNTSKKSPYKNLRDGNIQLAFVLNNDGAIKLSGIWCGANEAAVVVNNDANHTAIKVEIKLPTFPK